MEGLFLTPGHDALVCCSSSRQSHLNTVIQWDHSVLTPGLQILIIKAYLLADKFKDLIYVKQSLFLSQLGMGWGKRQPSISVWLRPDADCWHEEALTIIVWIRNSFRNAPNSHHTHFQSHKHSQLMHFIGVPGLEPPSIQFSNVLTWMSLGLGQFC